jgi:hypothetical protein
MAPSVPLWELFFFPRLRQSAFKTAASEHRDCHTVTRGAFVAKKNRANGTEAVGPEYVVAAKHLCDLAAVHI